MWTNAMSASAASAAPGQSRTSATAAADTARPHTATQAAPPPAQPRASLAVTVASPTSPRIEAAPTRLTAPGKPGSITEGSVDERGHHLVIHAAPAALHRFDVTLTIR